MSKNKAADITKYANNQARAERHLTDKLTRMDKIEGSLLGLTRELRFSKNGEGGGLLVKHIKTLGEKESLEFQISSLYSLRDESYVGYYQAHADVAAEKAITYYETVFLPARSVRDAANKEKHLKSNRGGSWVKGKTIEQVIKARTSFKVAADKAQGALELVSDKDRKLKILGKKARAKAQAAQELILDGFKEVHLPELG